MHLSRFLLRARVTPAAPRPAGVSVTRHVPQHHVSSTRSQHVYSSNYSQLASQAASAPAPALAHAARRENGASDGALSTANESRRMLAKLQDRGIVTKDKIGAVAHAEDHPRVLSVSFEKLSEPVPLSKVWLRDSCRCSTCVDPSSGQKNFETCDIPSSLKVQNVAIRDGNSLEVQWADDFLTPGQAGHKSLYPFSQVYGSLAGNGNTDSSGVAVAHTPWDRKLFEQRARYIRYSDWVAGGDEFWRSFVDLAQLGLIFIREVPDSETAVEKIAEAIGHIQTTFYGKTWDVVSKPQAENVAYTNVYLGLHQDLLYIKDPPRLQLLHCLANSCGGGESLFSDGVRAAEEVRRRNPEQFELLKSTPVYYHYDKNGHWYECNRPVVSMGKDDGGNKIDSIGWAPPFQDNFPTAPGTTINGDLEADPMEPWRAAARSFRDIACEPDSMYECKMSPGDCVIFDNMRVLHGRRQFNISSGKRWLKGTYIQEQVMTSKLAQIPRHLLPPSSTP